MEYGMIANQRPATLLGPSRFALGRRPAGNLQLLHWKPLDVEFQTNSLKGGWVMITELYYTEWKAEVGQGQSLAVRAALPEGLVEGNVPQVLKRSDLRCQLASQSSPDAG